MTILLPTDAERAALGYYHDPAQAEAFETFCRNYCIQTQSPYTGQPIHLLPYWRDIVYRLFGDKKPDGTNAFNRLWLFVPKKSAKTTMASIVCLYTLLREEGSEVYAVAATKEQARKTCYGQAAAFVRQHPALSAKLKCRDHLKVIERRDKRGEMIVWSSDHGKISGINPNLVVCDEIAEWGKAHARETWDKLQAAGSARRNPLMIVSTTAGFDKSSLAFELYREAKKVLSGDNKQDLQTLPVIYEMPAGDDQSWRDSSKWWDCLPAVDRITPKQWYLDQYARIENNPMEECSFKTLCLNMWIGSPDCWIPLPYWNNCRSTISEEALHGCRAVAGIDYGASYDLTAYVLIVEKEGLYHVLPRFFIPSDVAAKRETEHGIAYSRYSQDPNCQLTITPGNVVDTDQLVAQLQADARTFDLTEVRYDPTRLEGTRQNLMRAGFNTVEVSTSSKSMAPAFGFVERLVRDGKLRHPDCPLLNWNLGNCRPQRDRYDRLMVLKSGPYNKIDGIDALAIASTHYLEDTMQPGPDAKLFELWG